MSTTIKRVQTVFANGLIIDIEADISVKCFFVSCVFIHLLGEKIMYLSYSYLTDYKHFLN